MLSVVTFTTPSTNGGDGVWATEQRQGASVAVGPAYLYYNATPAAFPGFQVGDPMYVKVNYFDEGSGVVKLQYDSVASNFDQTEFHTRSSRVDTQQFVSSYHYLQNVEFANGGNGNDFRLVANGVPVLSVELSDAPFPDSGLEWAWEPPWESPYTGRSRSVDASTLRGKVLAGYQGWFNTPNDAADEGYVHWGRPGDWSVEQWPDVNDYDASEVFAVPGVTTASGAQAYLFSSADSSVVNRHFQWMRQHDIDGVFVQRFRGSFMFKQPDGSYVGEPQWPVVNARDAAHREGRTWSIEYDIQNGGTEAQRWQRIQEVKDDWEFLADPNGFDMLNDSHYQRESGKPVVAIFGLYVTGTNSYTTAQQADLIDFFHSRGVYVVGAGRHTQAAGQIANAGRHDAYIPWQGYWAGGNSFAPNESVLDGVTDHIPHIFPGFSWTHLQNDDRATSRDREDGEFYWRMISDAANETDAPWFFIGMFDEYDEGTNIIPASDDPPVPDLDAEGDSLTYQISDPRPNDWWLALTGEAKQALQEKIVIDDAIPSEEQLANRSNVGGEAVWQAAESDRLATLSNPDGQIQTTAHTVDGQQFYAIFSSDDYLYFAVDDGFLFEEQDGRDVTIEVEYLDAGIGQFQAEYESTSDFYRPSAAAMLTDSGAWRTHRFELPDARFGNRQNGGGDFRLAKVGGHLQVRRVRVIKESVLTAETDLGPSNSTRGLQQAEFSGDGQTTATIVDGRSVRQLSGSPTSLYMYMRVDDAYANEVRAGLNAVVEIVYRDVGSGSLNIQYDATSTPYNNATPVSLQNSGEWRTARFYLDDARFGNRQNGGADFRITGSNIPIDRVRVLHAFGDLMSPELETASATVHPTQSSVSVAWTLTDDWKTGAMDQWTVQEDNRVQIDWTNDGGATWNSAGQAFERVSAASQSGYDLATGTSTWSDEFAWDTTGLPTGTYQLRITPTDGRGNRGESLDTNPIDLVGPPAISGDFDESGLVDGADLEKWSHDFGKSVSAGTGADGSANGLVDGGDFLVWQRQLGGSLSAAVAVDDHVATTALTHQAALSVASWEEPGHTARMARLDAGFAEFSARTEYEQLFDFAAETFTRRVVPDAYEATRLPELDLFETQVAAEAHDEQFRRDSRLSELLADFEAAFGQSIQSTRTLPSIRESMRIETHVPLAYAAARQTRSALPENASEA